MAARKFIHDFVVRKNIRLNPRHFVLELTPPEKLPAIFPGQFVQVLVEDTGSTFLRRPFSIHFIDHSSNLLKLMIQIKGEGTRKLSRLMEGDRINLIYPLGNSFILESISPVLLIGGGCGVAPLLFLAQQFNLRDIRPTILIGGKTKKDLLDVEEYMKLGDVLISTEDGSDGEKGLVTEHSILKTGISAFNKIYTCGPESMMKKIAEITGKAGVDCEVSLENTMACGFGVCLCCVTPTVHGNERVCVEGPVFNTKELRW
ncbi:MAG: dihydroorotate dehydrogenase electron transfer subunit [Bacteroidetes bacterium]|nr:dihydroorotate dehydrogenase electron transfer subunit [Bacteroidota bacterium]